MIDDQELASLFREESEEHLQNLDEGLLALEKNPADGEVLQGVFRSAHSLKGAARMLGVNDVETVAHHFEDVLGEAARGQATLSSQNIERLYGTLDALRALVRESVTGTPSGVDVNQVLERLKGKAAPPPAFVPPQVNILPSEMADSHGPLVSTSPLPVSVEPLSVEPPHSIPNPPAPPSFTPPSVSTPTVLAPDPAPTFSPEIVAFHSPDKVEPAPLVRAQVTPSELAAPDPGWKIETIRVEPSRLDALLAMAGELIVATTRARRGRDEFETLSALWEEETKSSVARRHVLSELERALQRDAIAPNAFKEAAAALRELRRIGEREEERLASFGALLTRLRAVYDDVARLDGVASEMEEAVRGVRLLPLSTLFALFHRPVRDLAKVQGKNVEFRVEGGETTADKRILEELKDPLMHMVRNAVDHGIELPSERQRQGKPGQAQLVLRAVQTSTQVVIELRDDGRGLDEQAIARSALHKGIASAEELANLSPRAVRELIFAPGFSTSEFITDVSGRGVGLDVVRANVEKLRGHIEVESVSGRGTTFRLTLPVTLATTRVLLVQAGDYIYALPVENVHSVQLIAPREVFPLQNRPHFSLGGTPVLLASLHDLLEMPPATPQKSPDEPPEVETFRSCVVLMQGEEKLGVWVEEVCDEQEIILKPLGAFLHNIRNLAGATILDTGEVALVLQTPDLFKSAARGGATSAALSLPAPEEEAPTERPKIVLLVEDSITTRTQEKRILEGAGYRVVAAVDGLDGWNKLATGDFDAVVSDIEMPNMDGISLATRIRQNVKYKELPIILVTSLASDADRRRGVEAGANAYITKGGFDQKTLIDTLRRLV